MDGRTRTITALLRGADDGDAAAREALLLAVYDELHELAGSFLRRERAGHTLQPTALVNEAYLRLREVAEVRAQSRAQFLALAAQVMRRLLVDHARARDAAKRGGGRERVTLSFADSDAASDADRAGDDIDLVALDDALERLGALAPDAVRVVELRVFGGLTNEAIGSVLGTSRGSVDRRWRFARAWLRDALGDGPEEGRAT